MSFRAHLLLIIAATALATVAMLATLGLAFRASEQALVRTQAAGSQLAALQELDGAAGRYGRQVVDQILFGYDRGGELQNARNAMERVLATLARVTREELAAVGPDELQGELPELERVRRMTDLYHAIDAAARRAFSLNSSGDGGEAAQVLNREVDFRLTNEMQPLIDAGIGEERAEMAAQVQRAAEQQRTLLLAAAIASAVLLLVVGALVVLAMRVAARTAREREQQSRGELEAAVASARALEDGRSQLLADIGHQLRTPLTVLRGEADVALRGAPDAAALREAMSRVRAQAAELALLFDDLIEAARQDAEAQPMVTQPVRLDEVAAVALDDGRMLAEPREVTLTLDAPEGGVEVQGDFRLLRQAVMIGIDNAVKHSPPGSTIGMSVLSAGGRDGGRRAVLRIEDNGPGIAAEDAPYLFQRFYRGRSERDLLNPGFGIGLAIARSIVRRHRGDVALRNRPEGGAVFELTLPLGGGAR